MKRNGMAVPPAPRSFEELKRDRSGTINPSLGNSARGDDNAPETALTGDESAASMAEGVVAGSPWSRGAVHDEAAAAAAAQLHLPPRPSSGLDDLQMAPTSLSATAGSERHRYALLDDDDAAADAAAGAASSSPLLSSTPRDPNSVNNQSWGARRTGSLHGIDLSKSPTTAALAAGARAAGAAQPFFFSLKLPPASVTHVPVARTQSQQSAAAGLDGTASSGSPRKNDDGSYAARTTPRILVPTPGRASSPSSAAAEPQPTRDVGPLPASQARARNRLPSGTHIRRRPRSVANRRAAGGANLALTGTVMPDSVDNVLLVPGAVESGSPLMAPVDGAPTPSFTLAGTLPASTAGRSAFANPALRPRGSSGAMSGRGTGAGGGGGGRGTGRTRDGLPPSSSTANASSMRNARGAAAAGGAVPHRRRADPSPAPSRPTRARKAAAVLRANATPVTPALGMSVVPSISPTSPTQLTLAQSHGSSQQNNNLHNNNSSLLVGQDSGTAATAAADGGGGVAHLLTQHPSWSSPNSPGGASPLNSSLDGRYLSNNDKDGGARTANPLLMSGSLGMGNTTRSLMATTTTNLTASTMRPPSGRLLSSGALAHTYTPRTSSAGTGAAAAPAATTRAADSTTPKRRDYVKLAEKYTQLCKELGELPNAEWVSGLTAAADVDAPPRDAVGSSPPGESETTHRRSVQDLAATLGGVESSRDGSLPTSGAFSPNTTITGHAQLTPRGGARQRSGRVAGAAPTSAVTPRARTPRANRAKSPRGGAASAAASNTPGMARRSGSVGRITTVKRATMLGGSHVYGSTANNTDHTPRTAASTTAAAAAASETLADLYAQRVLRYCADHLQPYVDSMKQIQQQRHVLDEVLTAFVGVASSVIAPSGQASSGTAASAAAATTAMAGGGGDGGGPRKSLTPPPVNPIVGGPHSGHHHHQHHPSGSTSHSHRGGASGVLDSGKGGRRAQSPAPSSLSTTPRKPSTSRTSAAAASSLPNNNNSSSSHLAATTTTTAAAAAAAIMSRRTATAASAKAASLTEGLQDVQGAVVALLSSLGEGIKLAQITVTALQSPTHDDEMMSMSSQSFSKSGAFSQSYTAFAPLGQSSNEKYSQYQQLQHQQGSVLNTSAGNVAPEERSQTLAQLTSPTSLPPAALATATAIPHLALAGAISAARGDDAALTSPLYMSTAEHTSRSESGRAGAGGGATTAATTITTTATTALTLATAACPPPVKFLDFVETQEKEVAAQLSAVCEAVRSALGAPAPAEGDGSDSHPLDVAEHGTAAPSAAAAVTTGNAAGVCVQLEQADMLNNPFFAPGKYLQSLASHMAALPAATPIPPHADDEAATEMPTPKLSLSSETPTSTRAGAKTSGGGGKAGKTAGTTTGAKKTKGSKLSSAALGSSVNGAVAEAGGGLTGRSSSSSTPRHRPSITALAPLFTVRLSLDDVETPMTNADASDVHRRSVSYISNSNENSSALVAEGSISGGGVAETFVLHCLHPPVAGLTPRTSIDSDPASGRQHSAQFSVTDLAASGTLGSSLVPSAAATGGTASTKATGTKAPKRSTSAGAGKRAGKAAAEAPRTQLAAPWLNSQGGRGGGGNASTQAASSSAKKKTKKSAASSASGGATASASATSPMRSQLSSGGHQAAAQTELQQRQLVEAWRLWSALEQRFVSSRVPRFNARPMSPDCAQDETSSRTTDVSGSAFGEHTEETQQFSPRPSSASPKPPPPPSLVGGGSGNQEHSDDGGTADAEARATSTTTTVAPLVAASPLRLAQPLASDLNVNTNSTSRVGSPNLELEGTVVPSCTVVFSELPPSAALEIDSAEVSKKGEEDDDENANDDEREGDDGGLDATTTTNNTASAARVAESMAHLISALEAVPRKLDLDDSTGPLSADPPTTASAATGSQKPSRAAAASPSSSSSASPSPSPPVRLSEEQKQAALQLVEWWRRVHLRRRRAAQLREAHTAQNEQQRRRVMEARLRSFLIRAVYRRRLQKKLRAREAANSAAAAAVKAGGSDMSDSAEISSGNSAAPTLRGTAAPTSPKLSSKAGAAASASREKFLRAKEQRKANAGGAASTSKDAVSAGPSRVPPLPLAASGISTFAMSVYESDSSFTVSAIHRLLNAPPSLLYATCTAALHYPTHPPMAYVDNTSRSKSAGGGGDEGRLQSEAPPEPDARLGAREGGEESTHHDHHQGAGAGRSRRNSSAAGSEKSTWRTKGVRFVRFRHLRECFAGSYEARIPPRTVPAAMDSAFDTGARGGSIAAVMALGLPTLDSTVNPLAMSYRGGSNARQQAGATMLLVPATMRYDSVVNANELQQPKPVVKSFHRPFEQWGMAYNLTSRVFCAAAIYAWQLIFSHTPFDDAKQRELPTREERQARLERVAERNDIILDCYSVRNEREWMREATKDLSFVGQIYVPSYPDDDPAQEKEGRDNYEFVKNFLFQCFPNINKLADIQDFLVGAGVYFVLKEVFHISKDAPSTRRVSKYTPRLLVRGDEDYLRAVTPVSSPLYAGADDVGSNSDNENHHYGEASTSTAAGGGVGDGGSSTGRPFAAPTSLATPRATDYGRSGNGLSGLQRAALQRYEQLRQLHHLSYGMMDEEERAACVWGVLPRPQKPQQSSPSPSPATSPSAAAEAKAGREKGAAGSSSSSSKAGDNKTGGSGAVTSNGDRCDAHNAATSPLRRFMAHGGGANPVTPPRATPTATALASTFNTPASMREGPQRSGATAAQQQQQQASTTRRAATAEKAKRTVPSRDADIQLTRVPQRLLRSTAADAQFVRDYEDEVDRSLHRLMESVAGRSSELSLSSTDLLAARVDVHDALDVAYPEHFLVKLSEMLTFELFGLKVSLNSCEDLDATSS